MSKLGMSARAVFVAACVSAGIVLTASAQLPGTGTLGKPPGVAPGLQGPAPITTVAEKPGGMFQGQQIVTLDCIGPERVSPNAAGFEIKKTAGATTANIRCKLAKIDGKLYSGQVSVYFTEVDRAVAAQASVKLPASIAKLPSGIDNCAKVFQSFKSDPKVARFTARWRGLNLQCETDTAPLSKAPLLQLGFKPVVLPETFALGFSQRWLRDTPNGGSEREALYYDGLNPREGGATLSFFSKAPHGRKWAYLQIFQGENKPLVAPTCNAWNEAPGGSGIIAAALVEGPLDGPNVFNTNLPPVNLAQMKTLTTMKLGKSDVDNILKLMGGADKKGWMRLIPTDGQMSTHCFSAPSGWLRLDSGVTVNEMISNGIKASQQKKDDAKKLADQALASYKASGGDTPLNVTLVSYIPPHDNVDGNWVTNPFTAPKLNATPEKLASDKTLWTTSSSFNLASEIPWEKGKRGWSANCSYSPAALQEAVLHGPRGPEGFFEMLSAVWSMYVGLFDMIKTFAVELATQAITLGECPFSADPTKPPPSGPAACNVTKTVVRTGLNYALATVGMPPSLPTTQDLMRDGAEYIAQAAVNYTVEYVSGVETGIALDATESAAMSVVTDAIRQKAVSTIKKELLEAANQAECAFPARNYQDAISKGYAGYNPITGCGIAKSGSGDFYQMGRRAESPAGGPDDAVVWIRVTRNGKNATPGRPVTITVSTGNSNAPPEAPQWIKSLVGPSLRTLESQTLTLDPAAIPAAGLNVPVFLKFADANWKSTLAREELCPMKDYQAFQPGCFTQMSRYWHMMWNKLPQSVTITTKHDFTTDPAVLAACKAAGISCSTSKVINDNFRLDWIKGTYGVPQLPKACPGMKIATGEGGFQYVWRDVNMDKLELGN